ncbi:MAG: fibro-slime domain-containing protein, partial [Ruminococcus sp.]
MKKIISLVLCLTLLMSVAQLSAMADITLVSDVAQPVVSQSSDETAQTETTNENETATASDSADSENKSDESSPAGVKTVSNNLIKQYNGYGNDSNVFKVNAVNYYDKTKTVSDNPDVILVYPKLFSDRLLSNNMIKEAKISLESFVRYVYNQNETTAPKIENLDQTIHNNYADVRVEYRNGRFAVLQKHYDAEYNTGLQIDNGFILLVKHGTDQYEYLKSDLIADWRVDVNGDYFSQTSISEDYNGDKATLSLNSDINYQTTEQAGGCGTISFSHLDDGVMLGESSFQIDTINPTEMEHFNTANVIAMYPYAYPKNFDNQYIAFEDIMAILFAGGVDNVASPIVDNTIATLNTQGWAIVRIEKRGGVYVALQKGMSLDRATAVQNQDGFFVLARPNTYEYNYIRDKLYVAWDDKAGTSALSNGDLMNINEYITPKANDGDSIMHWGTANSAGYYSGKSFEQVLYEGTVEKNGRPYAYFNFYINNVVKRDVNEAKNTDLEVADNTNIKFQLFNYGTGINTKLFDISTYFNFRGLSGDGAKYNSTRNETFDADGFTANHATVERTLSSSGYPVLNLTRKADGGTKTDNSPLTYEQRANLGYLFGNAGAEAGYIDIYNPTNTILQKNGNHYTYDSAKNAVNYNGNVNKFFVRNYTERTSQTSAINIDKKTNYSDFLPFSNTEGLVKGTLISKDTSTINKYTTYQMDTSVDYDQFWFGMRMDFNFVQDKNGMLNNGEKMVFNFSGDDDVWVFIDDVLVLDLGGTHGKVTGSIDFATGKVKQYLDWIGTDDAGNSLTGQASDYGENATAYSFPTTIYDCFINAGEAASVEWKTAENGNKIFSDYSQHKLSFFYLERGAGCSNCSIDFALTTVSNDKEVAISKEAYDSNNNIISTDDATEYKFKVTDSNDNSLTNDDERKYSIGSKEYTLDNSDMLILKNGETALFKWSNNGTYKIVEQSKDYIAKTESSISGTSADGDSVSTDGKTVTVQPIENGTKYVKFKNTIKSLDVTLKYYGRETVNGKPADIKKEPTTYTKQYIGQDYMNYVSGDTVNIGSMITDTGVTFDSDEQQQDAKYKNVLDDYHLWTSQSGYLSGIPKFDNLHSNNGNSAYNKYTATPYHTNWYGYTQIESNGKWYWTDGENGAVKTEVADGQHEKWVTYYSYANGSKTEVGENGSNVTEVTIWLFNQPKQYEVKAYEAKSFAELTNVDGKYVAQSVQPKSVSAYYNQRLGLEIDENAEYSKATNHLAGYGIDSYVGTKLDTAYSVKDSTGNIYKFAYWAFDPDGKNIASTDILYNYRIVTNTKLYAVYTSDGKVNSGKPGLTVSENERDIFFNSSGTSITRLNTEMNPYNC